MTMRMLHWSSTSLGYMKPSTPGMSPFLLSHRAVQAVVVDLGAGGHLRLQDLHGMIAEELMDRIFRIIEIPQHPRSRGAGLAAGRGEAARDPVITEIAFVDRVRARIDEPAAVGARLHAIAAAQTVGLVH